MELLLGALPHVGCAVMMLIRHRESEEVSALGAEVAALRAERAGGAT